MRIYRLREAKTSQLKKLLNNGNITEDQFQIADEFFKKYNSFEKEIDWNKGLKITWDDLKEVIYKERNSESKTRKKIRKGLEGFEEGKDYEILEETSSYIAYQPFTWEASRMIASHYVEPSRNEDGDIDDADWCTAYQKDRDFWDIHNNTEAFIYICGESIPTKKVAISISKEDTDGSGSEFLYYIEDYYLNFNIWDFGDYNYTIKIKDLIKVVPDLYSLIEQAYHSWKKRTKDVIISKFVLNPETNRYDYGKSIGRRDLRYLVAENGDGFIINFGEVKGSFLCDDLRLISLKGAPLKVGVDFDCSYNELTSLEGSPKEVGRDFICSRNSLDSLKGSPEVVGESFDCGDTGLISLEGAPFNIVNNFDCSSNSLTSLKGAPETVGGNFYCNDNHLTSLEGAPREVGGNFTCSGNRLTSLKGVPQKIKGVFVGYRNPQLHPDFQDRSNPLSIARGGVFI